MTDEWDGQPRRAIDKRFAEAITSMRDMNIGIADLAEAVKVRTAEFQKVVRQVAILLTAMLLVLMVFSLWEVGRINDRLARGHDTITCLLLADPAQRTAQALIDCQKGGH